MDVLAQRPGDHSGRGRAARQGIAGAVVVGLRVKMGVRRFWRNPEELRRLLPWLLCGVVLSLVILLLLLIAVALRIPKRALF